jgi:membrane dipeptidase
VSPDPGLLREAKALHDEIVVVNGIDASILNEAMITSLWDGRVDVNVSTLPDYSPTSMAHRFLWEHRDSLEVALTVDDIHRARNLGKTAIVVAWQWVDIQEDVELLYAYQRLGLRSAGLVYNVGNQIGSGCLDPNPGGLSHFGVQVVETLQDLRIVVDIGGHLSEETSFDVLNVAEGPVVCTHTNCRALRDNPRNTTDGLMRAIADSGGVTGITAFNYFLVKEGRGTLEHYLRHIDHAVEVAGVEHVGLGLDLLVGRHDSGPVDPRVLPPEAYPQRYEDWIYLEGLEDFSGVPLITAGLMKRGYPPEDIEKIMGLNWLRVWQEVWGA